MALRASQTRVPNYHNSNIQKINPKGPHCGQECLLVHLTLSPSCSAIILQMYPTEAISIMYEREEPQSRSNCILLNWLGVIKAWNNNLGQSVLTDGFKFHNLNEKTTCLAVIVFSFTSSHCRMSSISPSSSRSVTLSIRWSSSRMTFSSRIEKNGEEWQPGCLEQVSSRFRAISEVWKNAQACVMLHLEPRNYKRSTVIYIRNNGWHHMQVPLYSNIFSEWFTWSFVVYMKYDNIPLQSSTILFFQPHKAMQ